MNLLPTIFKNINYSFSDQNDLREENEVDLLYIDNPDASLIRKKIRPIGKN